MKKYQKNEPETQGLMIKEQEIKSMSKYKVCEIIEKMYFTFIPSIPSSLKLVLTSVQSTIVAFNGVTCKIL